ncbi:hypothetical protein D3C85_1300400 [compost metagenome]
MADGEVAVGHPDAVAPGDIRRLRIHVGIRRAHVGHSREYHRVEPQAFHPVFEIDSTRLLQPAQPVGKRADLVPWGDAALGHPHVLVHAGDQVAFAVGQGPGVVREDQRSVHIDQAVQFRIAVGPQEVIERPGRQVPQFVMQELLGHQAAGEHGRCTRAIALAIGDQREIDLDHFGTGGFERLARRLP